jgi:hypothetical protein
MIVPFFQQDLLIAGFLANRTFGSWTFDSELRTLDSWDIWFMMG